MEHRGGWARLRAGGATRQVLGVLAVVGCWLVAVPATSSAAQTWSPPTDLTPISNVSSISCASASFCAATDSVGNAYTYYGGDEWSPPQALDPGSGMSQPYVPASVSCSSASFCLAVGYDQNYTNYAYTYDGSSWSEPTPVPGQSAYGQGTQMQSVSCVSASFCMAVDLYGAAFLYSGSPASWSGPTTITPSANNDLTSVSCASIDFCGAVDNEGEAYTYNAGIWAPGVLVTQPGIGLNSVSCPSSTSCTAVDNDGNAYSFNGALWGSLQSTPTNQGLTSVSCPSGSSDDFCAAGGLDNNGYAGAYIYSQTNPTWTSTNLSAMVINSSAYSITCATDTFCAATSGGDVFTYGVPIPVLQTLGTSLAGSGAGNISSSPSGIACNSTCSAQFDKPDQITLTETPATGSTFAGWSGGGCSGTQTACQVTMNADQSVTATFDAIPQTLTVAVEGSGSGTVSSSPSGVSCGSTCAAQFNHTSQVTLTETPTSGSTFAGWSGAGCSGTQTTCQVTMNATENVTASFNTTPPAATTATAPVAATPAPLPEPTPSPAPTPVPLKVSSISLTNKTVTWCWGPGCKYPRTQLLFDLNKPTPVRLVLSRHDQAGWHRVATASINGHAGLNRHRVAGRWNGVLVPAGPVQIALQVQTDGRWTTSQTLRLIVRHHRD
jgi:Divergent InlB B-repeat domain